MPATAARKKPAPDSPRTPSTERVTEYAEYAVDAPSAAPSSTRRSRAMTRGTVPARRSISQNRAQQAPRRRDFADAAPSSAEHYENVNETIDEMRPRAAHVRRTRRALHRAHRPFRLSLTVGMASGLVLLQLVALLWLKGMALTARNRTDVLDRKITEISGEIAKTEDAVAKLSSPPQIKQWAEELGMRPVTQADIDDVRQRTPLPATVMPDGSLPANTSRTNTSGKARLKEDER